jgi:hypothetical protein
MNDEYRFWPPWWIYPVSIGFILMGLRDLKKWREKRDPNASSLDRNVNDVQYLYTGIFAVASGITILIISIYQACTGWVAK